jgi:hypothetical protein
MSTPIGNTPGLHPALAAASAQVGAGTGTAEADAAARAAATAGVGEHDRASVAQALAELAKGVQNKVATAFKPVLPDLNPDALPPNMNTDDLIMWATNTFDKIQDKLGQVTMTSIMGQKEKLAQVNADKLEKIKDAQNKAAEAEPGFWGKAFGWISNIVTAVVAAVAIVVGALATATGAGALVGVPLLLLGSYMMAGAVVGMVEDVRREMGLPPLGWSPTLGQLASLIAKAAGASEETQAWIKMGVDLVTDIAVGIAMCVLIPGGAILAAQKVASAINKATQLTSMVRKVTIATEVVDGVASVGKGATGIDNALKTFDAANAKAEVKELVALLTKMQAMFQGLTDEIKKIQERQADNLQRGSDMVAERGAAMSQMTANMA